jgi:adenylate cyclase class IV
MKYKEIETKYDAAGVTMQQFIDFVEKLNTPTKWMMVSSFDDYFVNPGGEFIRYRYTDDRGELTIKQKTNDKNNNERIEVNLPTKGDNLKTVTEFCKLAGYSYNFGIYKTCKIAWVDKVVLVWYVVYDKDMKELRRFLEIEANEDLEWATEDDAWQEVLKYEKMYETLGVTPKHRLKKSLFEMFRKSDP